MMQVILHQVARHTTQRFLHGSHLRNDVRAVAVLFHHFLQAADLPLDTAEAVLIGLLQTGSDPDGLAPAGPGIAGTIRSRFGPILPPGVPRRLPNLDCHNTLPPYLYPSSLYGVKRLLLCLPPPWPVLSYHRS